MNATETLLNSSLTQYLGWTLMHFLWQGAVVGLVYAGMRQLLQAKSPAARYHLAMCALAVMAALPIVTFIYLANATKSVGANGTLHSLTNVSMFNVHQIAATPFSIIDSLRIWLQPLVPWVVPLWLLGVFTATLRVLHSWHHAYQLRETAAFAHLKEWHLVVEKLSALFGIDKLVRLAVSASVTVPSVIGWLKPIILIPPSTMAGLTPLQMELILAHELAHIRRQDYLWNLLQVAIETLLFYHPVVRWVSHQARLEREQCCDDMVVGLNSNVVEYARALTELESLRHSRSPMLLGANGGQVLDRIHRLLGLSAPNAPAFWLPLLLITGLLLTASVMPFTHQRLVLQTILKAEYAMMGDVRQQDVTAPIKSATSAMSSTHISTAASAQPAALKPVGVFFDRSPEITLNAMPKLAAPFHPTIATVNTATSVAHTISTPNFKAGTVIAEYSPAYPPLALERGVEGSAMVEFTLTSGGNIIDMRVAHVTGSRLFGQAAMDALHQWRISPAMKGGIPVSQRMREEFIFRLKAPTNSGACKIPMGYHVCTAN